ncbi:MAG: NYN domain-containing protein [Bacteroidetes bacterium]|nr:NYN domain-containing protein [Bacteroidota bacterium]
MKHYIIDGNNVIHKIKKFEKLLQKDKQTPREKLAFLIEDFFRGKQVKISLHYDGYERIPIKLDLIKIIYSSNKIADEKIKHEIESEANRKNIVVVTSDDNLKDFARKCSCEVISSEDFIKMILKKEEPDEETKIISEMNNPEYFKKLFGEK